MRPEKFKVGDIVKLIQGFKEWGLTTDHVCKVIESNGFSNYICRLLNGRLSKRDETVPICDKYDVLRDFTMSGNYLYLFNIPEENKIPIKIKLPNK